MTSTAQAPVTTDGAAEGRRRDRQGVLAALSASLVLAALVARRGVWRDLGGGFHVSLFDDAMISMSYARTAASGGGLVWYPGAEPVEGITNLGWTAVMVVLHRLGLSGSAAVVAVMLLGLCSVWVAALVGCWLVRSVGMLPAGGSAAFCAAASVSLNFPLLYWSVRGMEVGALTLLTVVGSACVYRLAVAPRGSLRTSAVLAASVVAGVAVRTDFLVVAAAWCVWLSWSPGLPRRRVPLLTVAVPAAVGVVATSAFRLVTYGRLVPNTYDLKAEGIDLGTRLARGVAVDLIAAGPYLVAPLVMVALSWRWLTGPERSLTWLVLLVSAAVVGYSTFVGGDAWEQFLVPNRYMTPAVVLLALIGVAATLAAWTRAPLQEEADRLAWVRRWSWGAAACALGPAIAIVMALSVSSLAPRLGGLAPVVDAGLLLPTAVVAAAASVVVVSFVRRCADVTDRRSRRRAAVALSLLLIAVVDWRLARVRHEDGTRYSELGDHVAAVTLPGATIAAAGVGGLQYWSGRAVYDVLGKSDPHIARSAPATPVFIPGHDKFDADRTVDELRPDVVAQGVASGELLRRGYVPVRSTLGPLHDGVPHRGGWVVFVRPDSTRVRWDLLEPVD